MHVDIFKAAAGGAVGFTVGLTGMGGGALMTPLLVLVFNVNPGTAVSSDLLTSLVMKPVAAAVHFRQGTVSWPLARWLSVGSVPAAFAGVFVLNGLGHAELLARRIQTLLGWALIVAAVSMISKALAQARSSRRSAPGIPEHPLVVKRVATMLIGAAGGFMVGMTSVGSGSLIMVMLICVYPRLSARRLVGTDMAQAIPLVGAATLSHALFGHIDAGLTASLLVGSVPGVYLGARVSSRAPDAVIRPALVVILLGSALRLLNVGGAALGWTMLMLLIVALPLWGATDAALQPDERWVLAGHRRTTWVTAQAVAAPFGLGVAVAAAYFARVRPNLTRTDACTAPMGEPRSRGSRGRRSRAARTW